MTYLTLKIGHCDPERHKAERHKVSCQAYCVVIPLPGRTTYIYDPLNLKLGYCDPLKHKVGQHHILKHVTCTVAHTSHNISTLHTI